MHKPAILYLDIETLPAPDRLKPVVQEQYDRQPGRSASFEDYYRGTALNANFGQILCIGYARDDAPTKVLQGDEAEQLRTFWTIAADADLLVGHAILNFDLPFIIKRSIILGIQPSKTYTLTREGASGVFDTKKAWDIGAGPAISLDVFAKIFDLPTSKIGIDGSQVYDFFLEGRLDEITAYCARDVDLTRSIYLRLTQSTQYSTAPRA